MPASFYLACQSSTCTPRPTAIESLITSGTSLGSRAQISEELWIVTVSMMDSYCVYNGFFFSSKPLPPPRSGSPRNRSDALHIFHGARYSALSGTGVGDGWRQSSRGGLQEDPDSYQHESVHSH